MRRTGGRRTAQPWKPCFVYSDSQKCSMCRIRSRPAIAGFSTPSNPKKFTVRMRRQLLLTHDGLRLASILQSNGRVYLNSPMWGRDDVFGIAAEPYLDEWRSVGDSSFWREWPCDETGWPEHEHLIRASPNWWTAKSAAHGLRRDVAAERVIHHRLGSFFDGHAPGRRALFVLYGPGRTAVLDRRCDASRRRS